MSQEPPSPAALPPVVDAPGARGGIAALRRSRATWGACVAALTFAVCALSLERNRQLDPLFTEEHFWLGWNLRHCGGFSPCETDPLTGWGGQAARATSPVFRAPGYPALIAATLAITQPSAGRATNRAAAVQLYADARRSLLWVNALLLAAAAAMLFALASRRVRAPVAAALALAFGTSAPLLVQIGLAHYAILHVAATVGATLALAWALEAEGTVGRGFRWVLAGACWGLVALVRPTALLLPAVFALVALWGLGLRRTSRATALLAAGLVLVVGPWTFRNWRLTERFIPVNAQSWVALWGATAAPLRADPNRYRWTPLWLAAGMPVYARATGATSFSYPLYFGRVLEIEDAFKEETVRNLRERPGVYAGNVLRNAVSFAVDSGAIYPTLFRENQRPGFVLEARRLFTSHPDPYVPDGWGRAVEGYGILLTVLAAAGAALALRRGNRMVLAPLAAWACSHVAHALTWLDMPYYYVKVPLLFLLVAVTMAELQRTGWSVPLPWGARIQAASLATLLLLVGGAAISAGVILA